MKKIFYFFGVLILLTHFSCENINEKILQTEEDLVLIDSLRLDVPDQLGSSPKKFRILSLGDSYTIGQDVCTKCKFPKQLKDSLALNFEKDTTFTLQIIAKTGWTTTSLIDAIVSENISSNFNLVTLLIGVNNQFRRKDFSLYETEFPLLVSTSIKAVQNNKKNVIVVSIPDYAFTPYGKGKTTISEGINRYNEFAKNYCFQNEITFVNITDITRQGLINPNLVASDSLHPSAFAYTKFVERILPLSIKKLRSFLQ